MPDPHPKALPPVDYLRACFAYDPDSGVIWWKSRPRSHFRNEGAYTFFCRHHADKAVTHIDPRGYRNLTLDRVHYRAARVIWKMVTGQEPPDIIDHADRNKLNNRWSNLRAATSTQSIHNRSYQPDSFEYRGVQRSGKKWQARIRCHGANRYLGTYTTAKEAAAAYADAARKLQGKFYAGKT